MRPALATTLFLVSTGFFWIGGHVPSAEAQLFRRCAPRLHLFPRRPLCCYTEAGNGCGTCKIEYDEVAGVYVWLKDCSLPSCLCSIQFAPQDEDSDRKFAEAPCELPTIGDDRRLKSLKSLGENEFTFRMYRGRSNVIERSTKVAFRSADDDERTLRIMGDFQNRHYTKWNIEIDYLPDAPLKAPSTTGNVRPTGQWDMLEFQFSNSEDPVKVYFQFADGAATVKHQMNNGRFVISVIRARPRP